MWVEYELIVWGFIKSQFALLCISSLGLSIIRRLCCVNEGKAGAFSLGDVLINKGHARAGF